MHGSGFLGTGPCPLRPALRWNDQRTVTQRRAVEQESGGRGELIRQVSHPVLTGFTTPKILWFMQNEPAF